MGWEENVGWKEVLYKLSFHRGRGGRCIRDAQSSGEMCWAQCASIKVGQIPVVELRRGLPTAGTSKGWNPVCVYILCCPWVGSSPNDSWPHSLSLLAFYDLGPKGHRGPECCRWDKKLDPRKKKIKSGLGRGLMERE